MNLKFISRILFQCLKLSNLEENVYLVPIAPAYFFVLKPTFTFRQIRIQKFYLAESKYVVQSTNICGQSQGLEHTLFPEGTLRFLRLKF